jgi:hypothetical protein
VTATNNTAKTKSLAGISMVGLRRGRIQTGGVAGETLYPHTPKIVKITIPSPALCPTRVDEVRATSAAIDLAPVPASRQRREFA